jgi:hypothetical protein
MHEGKEGSGTIRTYHSVPYSVPEMGKPSFEQYEAQKAGVIEEEEVYPPVRARPKEGSATMLGKAT